jgi:hypothetical protein
MNTFVLITTNDKIWNIKEFYSFLLDNQNKSIKIILNPEAACLEYLQVYDILDKFSFQSVTINTSNLLERHNFYKIAINKPYYYAEEIPRHVENLFHSWNGKKIFLCLYGRPSANRLGFISYLNRHHQNLAHLSCHGNSFNDVDRTFFELEKLYRYRAESLVDFGEIATNFPLLLNKASKYSNIVYDYADTIITFYKDIFVDLVSETFLEGNVFFPTEKTFRPMLLKKPFIIMGPKNYMIYLRQMGFQTFYEYWDEDYDGYSPSIKFKKILDVINNLSGKSVDELVNMYESMQNILDHNYNLITSNSFQRKIRLVNDK